MIVSSFVEVPGSQRAVLLLHQMPADRSSWQVFQDKLAARGLTSLAIDLRGHGESTVQNGRTIDYRKFSDVEHQASAVDVTSALHWLTTRGFPAGRVALVGASIGANLVLQAATKEAQIPAVVLLSPGENYRGVLTYSAAAELKPAQALWAAGSQGDDQESYDAAKHIVELAPSKTKIFKPYTAAGHGTFLFQNDPKLMDELADWLATNVK